MKADRPIGKIAGDGGEQSSSVPQAPVRNGFAPSGPQAGQSAPARAPDPGGRASVTDQIAESIRSGAARPGREIVIRLHPPELGRVHLSLQAEGKEVRAVLEVENSRTLSEIQRETPALIQRLAEGGVQLRRMDINLNEQGSGDGADSPLRDGQSDPQERPGQWPDQPTDPEAEKPASGPEEFAAAESGDPAAASTFETGAGTINLWI